MFLLHLQAYPLSFTLRGTEENDAFSWTLLTRMKKTIPRWPQDRNYWCQWIFIKHLVCDRCIWSNSQREESSAHKYIGLGAILVSPGTTTSFSRLPAQLEFGKVSNVCNVRNLIHPALIRPIRGCSCGWGPWEDLLKYEVRHGYVFNQHTWREQALEIAEESLAESSVSGRGRLLPRKPGAWL